MNLIPGVLAALLCAPAHAATYSLAWDLPAYDDRITGYELHYGDAPGERNGLVSIPGYDTAEAEVDVPDGAQFLAIRSVGGELYSNFSNELLVGAEPSPAPTWNYLYALYDEISAYSLWGDEAIPAVPSDTDTAPVELGVRFQSESDGAITGVRFYKGSGNTGTHIGRLWDAEGVLLASVTFTDETAAGWQQASFPTPVPVTADTVYVASYHAPAGGYAVDIGYFEAAFNNPPLFTPVNAGVYLYGAGGFPTNVWSAANYWVDVVFE